MKTVTYFLGIVSLVFAAAADDTTLLAWQEDFSSSDALESFQIKGKYNTREHWKIENGALRGKSFQRDAHPAYFNRNITGTDVTVEAKFKIPADSFIQVLFVGDSPVGDWGALVRLMVRPDGLLIRENRYAAEPGSEEAKARAAAGKRSWKISNIKKLDVAITTDVWHKVVFETRGNRAIITVNDEHSVEADTSEAGAEKSYAMFTVGMGDAAWFDDIKFRQVKASAPE